MTDLPGIRVLVVEDEGTVALLIEDMLEDLGCEIAASASRLTEACSVAATAEVDVAVLDVNLNGELVFPVAEILRERQIPFLFSTGYGARGLPDEFADRPVLSKPFSRSELQHEIVCALRRL